MPCGLGVLVLLFSVVCCCGLPKPPVQDLECEASCKRSPELQHWKVLQKVMHPDATMLSSTCTRHTVECLDKGSSKLSYQLLGLTTKGLEDNTTEELLEPGSSEAKIPS